MGLQVHELERDRRVSFSLNILEKREGARMKRMSDLRRLMGELRYVRLPLKRLKLYISVSYEGSRLDDEGFLGI